MQVNECIFMCVLNCIKFEDVDGEVVSVCIYIYMCVCVGIHLDHDLPVPIATSNVKRKNAEE